MQMAVVFGLLQAVNFLESLLDHPKVFSMLYIELYLTQNLEKSVSLLIDL